MISYSQATPISERHRDDDERHEEDDSEDEGYKWEVARQAKRKKCTLQIHSATQKLLTDIH